MGRDPIWHDDFARLLRCVCDGWAMPGEEEFMSGSADELSGISYQTIVHYGMVISGRCSDIIYGMKIDRVYDRVIERHLAEERQMVFLSGPRQVGKTTLCEAFQTVSMN